MTTSRGAFQDWAANRGSPHLQLLLVLFRLAHDSRRSPFTRAVGLSVVVGALYRLYALFCCSFDVPVSTSIGAGFGVRHGMGVVIHAGAVIGREVTIRQGVTIGSLDRNGLPPVLEDGVDVGAGAMILGPVRLGAQSRIGAGAVVLRDVPAGASAVGNPARVLPPAAS